MLMMVIGTASEAISVVKALWSGWAAPDSAACTDAET